MERGEPKIEPKMKARSKFPEIGQIPHEKIFEIIRKNHHGAPKGERKKPTPVFK
jgi:hypothetical protein